MWIETIRSQLNADSVETVATIASEGLERWSTSGNDPPALRGVELWKTPGGGTETGFVSAVADR